MTASQQWAAPALPAGPRRALIVATTEYRDAALSRLRSPAHDAATLRAVLTDAGGFEVEALTDASAGDLRGAIADFTAACGRDHLALVYLSCHGLLDAHRRVWFAAAYTVKTKMVATGVEASWLMDRMTDCRARQQVVVLDCCFSGAFAQGAKGDDEAALESQLKARDDNPGSNEFLVQNFTARGAVVYPAMTTNQAVQFLGEMGFDALIFDISRNGREVGFDDLTRLWAAGYAGPAIFFSSRITADLRDRAKNCGADGIVSSTDELSDWLLRVRSNAGPREPQSGFFARMRDAFNG
jgi:CheY-like chemotaxis protein